MLSKSIVDNKPARFTDDKNNIMLSPKMSEISSQSPLLSLLTKSFILDILINIKKGRNFRNHPNNSSVEIDYFLL